MIMKEEEKELLLRDLSARLPYNVKALCPEINSTKVYKVEGVCVYYRDIPIVHLRDQGLINMPIKYVKPYLFPLKTMTIEQRNEFYEMTQPHILASFDEGKLIAEVDEYRPVTPIMMYPNMVEIDWLFKRHFDVFGLIEKGLAIDASNLNIY